MLQIIRDRLTGWVAILILGVIGLSLVISFGNMSTDAVSSSSAASVNGEEIPMVRFREVYQNQLLRQQEAYQGAFPPELQQQLQISVLEGLVRNRVLSQYSVNSGYRADDETVAEFIRTDENFQIDGEFAQQSYIAILASQGISPEAYEEDQRAALQIGQIQTGIIGTAFYTPAEYRRFIELERETRDVVAARFEPVSLLDQVEVTEADILTAYESDAARFQTEESVSIEYIEVKLADIAASVVVDDEEVRSYYEANVERFRTAEERRSAHILIVADDDTTEEQVDQLAIELRERIDAGEDFAALAAEYSDDPGSAAAGGDLGWAGTGVFVPEFEAALFSLDVGEVSAPVRTQFGVHLIQLLENRPGTQQPFEEVAAELREELQTAEAEDGYFELAEQLDELALENPGSLDIAAQATGLSVQRAEDITRLGGAPFGFNQALVDAAFSVEVLEDGENSPLVELAESSALVLRVVEHSLPETRPLDEVRAEIEQTLRLRAAAAASAERGQALLARVEAGESLEAVSDELGLELVDAKGVSRSSGELPADVLAEIFRVPPPADGSVAAARGLESADGSYTVYRVDQVVAGRPEEIPRDERDRRKQVLGQQSGSIELTAMIQDLREAASVQISPDALSTQENF